MVGLLISTMAA